MWDRATRISEAARRAALFTISIAAVVATALVAPRFGWSAGLGMFALGTLVLVVLLLAIAPDDDAGEGASDTSP